jgi:hypothetical protein
MCSSKYVFSGHLLMRTSTSLDPSCVPVNIAIVIFEPSCRLVETSCTCVNKPEMGERTRVVDLLQPRVLRVYQTKLQEENSLSTGVKVREKLKCIVVNNSSISFKSSKTNIFDLSVTCYTTSENFRGFCRLFGTQHHSMSIPVLLTRKELCR